MKIFVICFGVLLSFNANADLSGKVVVINDGDTLIVNIKGIKTRVRLLGVDGPEIDFNGHTQGQVAIEARDFLRNLIPLNSEVILKPQEKSMDSHGRLLAQVFYQGQDINYLMLKSGWGAMYFIFPFDKKIVRDYSLASESAIAGKLGSFDLQFAHEPLAYIFRQSKKGFAGNNFAADFELKKIFSDVEMIPAHRRVFFPSEEIALSHGYRW